MASISMVSSKNLRRRCHYSDTVYGLYVPEGHDKAFNGPFPNGCLLRRFTISEVRS